MSLLKFHKLQGAGNDFILIDDREERFDITNNVLVKFLCDRRFGIGADGLMLLRNRKGYDFQMIYYNSDGNESSMCGNGGRCIAAFADQIGLNREKYLFLAIDGDHDAELSLQGDTYWVKLGMIDVTEIEVGADFSYLNTGSPHYVKFVNGLKNFHVVEEAKKIRYSDRFKAKGTNVNFVEIIDGVLHIRTYERGVEDETLACGTGVTAAVIAAYHSGKITQLSFQVQAMGGELKVSFTKEGSVYANVCLEGPAKFVFKGEIDV
ncbi:MAG: diaminopimelate epimerase [Bacteroidetes bacterium]|nr:diaminopimelate epimerase [Bacteroidota bacterium]